jgi:AraC-like DNA-binding protein
VRSIAATVALIVSSPVAITPMRQQTDLRSAERPVVPMTGPLSARTPRSPGAIRALAAPPRPAEPGIDAAAQIAPLWTATCKLLRSLKSYRNALENGQVALTGTVTAAMTGHIVDLAALLAEAKVNLREFRGTSVKSVRTAAALDYIGRSFSRQGLNLLDVARAQGISARYLQLLLDEAGTSFTAALNKARLDEAHVLLSVEACRERRIADIALEIGYSDISYFNRQFRLRFGMSPSEVRAAARQRMTTR